MWFFNPKNVTAGSGVDQNKKKLLENFEFSMASNNFPLKKGIFWPMGQKFLFWSMLEPMVTFLGLKNHTCH